MHRTEIKSSQIKSIGYSEKAKQLEIEFHGSNSVYLYDGVPKDIHEALMRAVSPGHYFAVSIRACFPYSRLHIDGKALEIGALCDTDGCWCRKQRRDVTNANLEKELKKAIRQVKDKKAAKERADRNRSSSGTD